MKDAERLHIGPYRALHTDQIKIDGKCHRNGCVHHKLFAETDANQIGRNENNANRPPAVQPEIAQVDETKHFISLFVVLQRVMIADAGGHAVKNLRKKRGQGADKQRVVGSDARSQQTTEICDNNIVGVVDDQSGNPRQQKIAGVGEKQTAGLFV